MTQVLARPTPGVRAGRGIWRHTRWDALPAAYSVAYVAATLALAARWQDLPPAGMVAAFATVALMTSYHIIVVSHLFTHVPWFTSGRLNAVASLLNSAGIGQSVQIYQFTHVRNHHRFNNDRPGPDGRTRDTSSTYRDGNDGDHTPLGRYVVSGALDSVADRAMEILAITRLWRVGPKETRLLELAANREPKRSRELRQVQADRAAHCLALAAFVVISWQFTVLCYIPAFCTALCLVNVQNYYRHYGADPSSRTADSVSYYGRLYNLLSLNDGYHQEHHLSPATHWSKLPALRERNRAKLDGTQRVISSVPAMIGFLDRRRVQLHRSVASAPVPSTRLEES